MRRVLVLLALTVSAIVAGLVAFLFTSGTRIEPARPRTSAAKEAAAAAAAAPPKAVRGTLRPGPKGGVYFDECGAAAPAWLIDDTFGDLTRRWAGLVQGGASRPVWIEALASTDMLPSARLAPGCDRAVRVSRVDRLVPEGDGARCGG